MAEVALSGIERRIVECDARLETPMTEPDSQQDKTRVQNAELPTGVMRGMQQLDSLNARVEPLGEYPDDITPPPYVKERLFSRKVLFGWAAATLIVWFAFSFIVPVILESVKTAVVESIRENAQPAGSNTRDPGRGAQPALPVPPTPDALPAPAASPAPSVATPARPGASVEIVTEDGKVVKKIIIKR
jgi:hypothetical protein